MNKSIFNGACAIFLCFLTVALPAHAGHNVEKLTENNIRAFVQDVTSKANQVSALGQDTISQFFYTHLHPKAFFKSSMKYLIPGYPTQENSITYNKQQYIESLLTSQSKVQDFEAEVTVQKIKISRDKKKATIETVTSENAVMKVPQNGTTEYVPMYGQSTCSQILMLNDANDIQIYSANCSTEMSFDSVY